MLFRQVRKQHLAHERRTLGFADHQDAIDDQRSIDFFVHEFEMKLVGNREAQQVGDSGAVKGRQQRHSHKWTEFRRVGHVSKHLHHADQGPDHSEGWCPIAYCSIDLLTFVQMCKKIVAVTFEVVANKIAVVTVGNKANTLSKKRIIDFNFFQTDWSRLARNFGKSGQFVHEVALAHTPERKSEFGAEWQPMKNRRQREAYQGSGE